MRFPSIFRRDVTTTLNPALFSDDNPRTSTKDHSKLTLQDNALSYRLTSTNGWPVQRIAFSYADAPVGAVSIKAQLFVFEEQCGKWLSTGAAKVVAVGDVAWFDLPIMCDNANNRDKTSPGGLDGYIFLATNTAGADPAGTHVFVMGPDTSNTT